MARLDLALALLNELIDKGMEYPDAEYRALQKHPMEQEVLMAAYDKDQVERSQRPKPAPKPPELPALVMDEANDVACFIRRRDGGKEDVIHIHRICMEGSLSLEEWQGYVDRLAKLFPPADAKPVPTSEQVQSEGRFHRQPVTEDDGRKAVSLSEALSEVLPHLTPTPTEFLYNDTLATYAEHLRMGADPTMLAQARKDSRKDDA